MPTRPPIYSPAPLWLPPRSRYIRLYHGCTSHDAANILAHGNDHHGPVYLPDGTRWYDVACGPVAAFWRQKYAMHDADQYSFHTDRGVRLLNQLIQSGNKKFFDSAIIT